MDGPVHKVLGVWRRRRSACAVSASRVLQGGAHRVVAISGMFRVLRLYCGQCVAW